MNVSHNEPHYCLKKYWFADEWKSKRESDSDNRKEEEEDKREKANKAENISQKDYHNQYLLRRGL